MSAPTAAPTCIAWFGDVSRDDVASVGGKGANLGELDRRRVRRSHPASSSPPTRYLRAMDAAGVRAELRCRVETRPTVDEPAALAPSPSDCQDAGPHRPACPTEVAGGRARRLLAAWATSERVAVRSSATAEDTARTSFAGMNETFTNVVGARRAARAARRLLGVAVRQRVDRLPGQPAAARTSRRSPSSSSAWSTPSGRA